MKNRFYGLKVFSAAVLSVLLFFSVALTSATSLVGKAVDHETVQEVIVNMDTAQLLRPGGPFYEAMRDYGLDPRFMEEALASRAMSELLEVYMQDVLNETSTLDLQRVSGICHDNLSEITQIVGSFSLRQGEQILSKSQVGVLVDEFLHTHGQELLDKLPQPGTLLRMNGDTVISQIFTVIRISAKGIVFWAMLTLSLLLAAGIYLLRMEQGTGLLWLCAVGVIAGVVCALVGYGLGALVDSVAADGTADQIVRQMARLLEDHCLGTTLWLFGLSALLGVGSVFDRKWKNRSKRS